MPATLAAAVIGFELVIDHYRREHPRLLIDLCEQVCDRLHGVTFDRDDQAAILGCGMDLNAAQGEKPLAQPMKRLWSGVDQHAGKVHGLRCSRLQAAAAADSGGSCVERTL